MRTINFSPLAHRQLQATALTAALYAVCLLPLLLPQQARAQAYCALRDPASHIQQLYPDSTRFRSIVKTVDERTRQYVNENLPPNVLHFGELGRHTLYVALRNKQILGLVHVRSEESRWGLVEIAWSMDLNLNIQDYSFQRCRNRARHLMETTAVKDQFRGKNFAQLKTLLANDGRSANRQLLQVPDKAVELAGVVIRNGLKTLLVTQQVWAMEIEALQMLQQARKAFPAAARIQLNQQQDNPSVTETLQQAFGDVSLGTDRQQTRMAKVLDAKGQSLGVIYKGIHRLQGRQLTLWWGISPNMTITSISSSQPWPSIQAQQAFQHLHGRTFTNSDSCGSHTELMALETLITSRPLLTPQHNLKASVSNSSVSNSNVLKNDALKNGALKNDALKNNVLKSHVLKNSALKNNALKSNTTPLFNTPGQAL
ncbi:MAG: hypothetical protein OIF57_16125 [Marinobacterium sp.]|nr:hypothetical protein [Marinobacterium sp.]